MTSNQRGIDTGMLLVILPTETAVSISVPLNGASVIELVSNLEGLFPDEDTGVIWGDAMVIP